MDQRDKIEAVFVVLNEKGLHTRPSTELVRLASRFKSKVTLHYHDLSVNAKSLLGILMLAASRGAKVRIEAEGEDAKEAIEAIRALAGQKFNMRF